MASVYNRKAGAETYGAHDSVARAGNGEVEREQIRVEERGAGETND
jgi:hypothetical protein